MLIDRFLIFLVAALYFVENNPQILCEYIEVFKIFILKCVVDLEYYFKDLLICQCPTLPSKN